MVPNKPGTVAHADHERKHPAVQHIHQVPETGVDVGRRTSVGGHRLLEPTEEAATTKATPKQMRATCSLVTEREYAECVTASAHEASCGSSCCSLAETGNIRINVCWPAATSVRFGL
jgi:hypothetical protein